MPGHPDNVAIGAATPTAKTTKAVSVAHRAVASSTKNVPDK